MNFKMVDNEFLNCQITNKKGVQGTYAWKKVSYTTSLENYKKVCKDMGFQGNFSEKSFKVAGVSEAFNQNCSMEDVMYHGRWKSLDTPAIYCHQNRIKRLRISRTVT